jgi:GntR family transcriptional repressor for pyruvate dehydrogenase complex
LDVNVKHSPVPFKRSKSLAQSLVDALSDRIRDGRLPVGEKLPSEAAIEAQFGVSRTVVREAISRLQAAGLVNTRHGIGTFVVRPNDSTSFKLTPENFATLRDVIAVLELRIGVEVEAAALAAQRRTEENLRDIETALTAVQIAIEAGMNAVSADFQFHLEIARASQNRHFEELMSSLGSSIIPRARLSAGHKHKVSAEDMAYLRMVNVEHENILQAIRQQDPEAARAAMRTHLSNSKERRRQLMQ